MTGPQKKNLDAPDERIQLDGVIADVVQVGDASISRSVFQPGAHCALGGRRLKGNHRAEESCQAHHTGVAVEGALHVEMDDGSTMDVGPNEVFDVPPGHDGRVVSDGPFIGINWSGVRTWLPEPESGDRVVATLLFTDIVSSTEMAVRLGDGAWRELLGRHNREVRDQLDRYRGREVATTGDGFLAVFDGAARAVHAARAIRDRAQALGLEVRAGIHTGEVEVVGDDVRGVAVHEAARISGAASAGQILVSSTTHQLASGAGITFEEKAEQELKGLAGRPGSYTPWIGTAFQRRPRWVGRLPKWFPREAAGLLSMPRCNRFANEPLTTWLRGLATPICHQGSWSSLMPVVGSRMTRMGPSMRHMTRRLHALDLRTAGSTARPTRTRRRSPPQADPGDAR